MFKMNVSKVVAKFVEAMLPRFSDPKTVLVMCLELRVYESFRKNARRYVHLMFHRPDNYTKVLWHVAHDLKKETEIKIWELKIDHDSEWVSSGLESPMRKLAEEISFEHGLQLYPLNRFSEAQASFSLFFGDPKLVTLKSYKYNQEERTFAVEYE